MSRPYINSIHSLTFFPYAIHQSGMSNLPSLISDLALILISAGIVTLIFKRLGQPLVLGYIVAGVLAGPHTSFTPTVADTGSIQTWADIGVIFLMFTLGLEFSFKKILRMGASPIIAACTVMFCMISLGSLMGRFFGWSSMDSLFLGGMLAMSSTTIIYKAFDDMGLRQQKFSGEVLSVLILEDILGILLMVVLSAVAVSRDFQGWELINSLLKLGFFLILWFIVGVFVIPTFLRKSGRWMTGETLLIVATGMCFALVLMASRAGYSSAFGAFMMGSILAETIEAETIEKVVGPVKDLFGAIFFVSVGMLVDPEVLAEYWQPVCYITLTVIVGQILFGTGSFLLAGHPLKTAMQCGFSLAQIGEFAFIIATLGINLHVTGKFLYPVVVAVSVITTFLTPYMIKAAVPAYTLLSRMMPAGVRKKLDSRSQNHASTSSLWLTLLRALVSQVSVYLTLSIAVILLALGAFLPFFRTLINPTMGSHLCGILSIAIVSPFLRAIVMRKNHSEEWKQIHRRGKKDRILLQLTFIIRYAIAAAPVWYILQHLSPINHPMGGIIHALLSALLVGIIIKMKLIKWISIRLERTFVQNLRSREERETSANSSRPGYAHRLLSHNMHMAQILIPAGSKVEGRTLRSLDFSKKYNVLVAAIIRGTNRINIPDGNTTLFPGDKIEAIGDDESIVALTQRINADIKPLIPNDAAHHLTLRRLILTEHSPLCHHTLKDCGLRDQYRCMAVGFENMDGSIDTAVATQSIKPGDTLWLVGEDKDVARIVALNAGKENG